jgi:nitrous oxidase accessory protein NosD/ABC-type nitrate/sulfonate/bicarbonate transport system substrate-binding protein
MKSMLRTRKVWISALAAIAVGGTFLLAWRLTHQGLPEGSLMVPRDVATISEALERVAPGGVIVLDAHEGPFSGPIVIRVPGVTLRSKGQPAVLRGGGNTAIEVVADGVTLNNLIVQDASVGIVLAGAECRVRNVSIESCDVGLRFLRGEQNVAEALEIVRGRIGIDVLSSAQTLRDIVCSSPSAVGIRLRGVARSVMEHVDVEGTATGVSLVDCVGSRLTGLALSRCSQVGLEILGGSDNTVTTSEIRDTTVGILLQATQSGVVDACRFETAGDPAVDLADARGCRVSSTDIRSCRSGVRIAGGRDNAVLDGRFRGCGDTSIDVAGSENVLIFRNTILEGGVAISVDRSSAAQVLRNQVTRVASCGILLHGAERTLLLDNFVEGGDAGVVVVSSDGALLQRNTIVGSRSVGLTLANGLLGSTVTGNCLREHPMGLLVAGSSRDVLAENEISNCKTGILLHRVGYGIQVKGNRIVENDVGLSWDDVAPSSLPLEALGFQVDRPTSGGSPMVSGNVFRGNRTFDIEARTGSFLYASGNTLRESGAAGTGRVSGDVRLPQSAWKGTVVVGAGASPTSRVLGRLLELCLADAGFRVVDLVGFSSEEALVAALARGDVDAAWCLGDSGTGAFWGIPARAGWVLVASGVMVDAQRATEPGTTRRTTVSVAASPGVSEGLVRQALDHGGFIISQFRVAATADAAETALQFGEVDVAVVDRIDETATPAGFRAIDDGGLLPSVSIGLALSATPSEGLRDVFLGLAPWLTEDTLHGLVSRVRLLHRTPLDVARDFLLREALIAN